MLQSAAHDSMEKVMKDHLIASCRQQLNINPAGVVLLKIYDEDKLKTATRYFIYFHNSKALYVLYLIWSLLGSFHFHC